ncbi:MAG: hypothetical protein H0X16_01505 [Chloroflexi bacterium]|nr:hypothetical protein [Chloroflexota bacterium]
MSFLDRLLGRNQADPSSSQPGQPQRPGATSWGGSAPRATGAPGVGMSADEQALSRYRYMLKTAPPEDIERAHEAFSRLSPEQRQMVLQGLAEQVPPSERATSDDPRELARMATRAEMHQPGTIERTFGGGGYGSGMPGLGSMFMYSLAGSFIGTAIASQFFANDTGYNEGYAEGYQEGQAGDTTTGEGSAEGGSYGDEGAAGSDAGADTGSYDTAGYDPGADGGGGHFGGGDFGGGDFGGGDF